MVVGYQYFWKHPWSVICSFWHVSFLDYQSETRRPSLPHDCGCQRNPKSIHGTGIFAKPIPPECGHLVSNLGGSFKDFLFHAYLGTNIFQLVIPMGKTMIFVSSTLIRVESSECQPTCTVMVNSYCCGHTPKQTYPYRPIYRYGPNCGVLKNGLRWYLNF